MRRILLCVCALLLLATAVSAKNVKIHGFVTTVNSPTNFEIDEYKITKDALLALEVEKDESGDAKATFNPEDIRVGTELEIKGDCNESTGELKAKSIKVFLDDTKRIKRTALLEKIPSLEKTETGWRGTLFVDGQRVAVTDSTAMVLKPNKGERKQAKRSKTDLEPEGTKLTSLDGINLDTFVHYEGIRQKDGTVIASKVEFRHAELEEGEAKMWQQLSPKVKDADYMSLKPGELKVAHQKYKLVPSKEALEYITKLGESLIPPHQKELLDGNPLKIPFKFYLVENKAFNAAAYPNGVVIVHSGVFDVCENEAQFAFVLAHEITHALEKHIWQQHEYHKRALMALRIGGAVGAGFGGRGVADLANMIEAGIRNGYARSLENQADRVGMEWMLASGYDIREAPRAWKAVAKRYGDRSTNLFWDNHDNNTTRRSYLMAELRNNYSDLDYSQLKKDSDEFHRIAEAVRDASQGKRKLKIKVAGTPDGK
ncbi:MAG: M48 family metallopeptidase [Terriglobales bacterium]